MDHHRKLPDFALFAILSYAITWILLGPWFYCYTRVWHGTMPRWVWSIVPVIFLGGWGPSIAALLVMWLRSGRRGVTGLLRSLILWRVRLRWYVFALVVPIVAVVGASVLTDLRPVVLDSFNATAAISSVPLAFAMALPFGPLGEELGWRGYALPHLLRTTGPWTASLTLGVLWTFWHVPMIFLMPGAALPEYLPLSVIAVLSYLVEITAVTGIMTFLFLRTEGSVLITALFHLTFNTARTILFAGLPEPTTHQLREVYFGDIAMLSVTAVVCLASLSCRGNLDG
jgi:uncharacterized protein